MSVRPCLVLRSIQQLLHEHSIEHRQITHGPTLTSQESAAARGEPLSAGGKALLLKCDDEFVLFVLPADRKLDSKKLKTTLGLRRLRFATADELLELTGLVPGAVPPFGRPVLPFRLLADRSIGQDRPMIAFNAGLLTESIVMPSTDWLRLAQPEIIDVTSEP